jgi:hypothetical protein
MNKANVLAFLDAEIERLQEARQLLSGNFGDARGGSRQGHSRMNGQGRRRMSAEAKRRISIAQKKRWAARKRAQGHR